MAKAVESDGWQNESSWSKTDEAVTTKDSWESNASKNDDKRQSGSFKRRGGNSTPQEGWGNAPKNKDSGGWGTSSSNYEEVENWGITQQNQQKENDDMGGWNTPSANNKESKNNWGDNPADNGKDTKDADNWNSTTNENKDDWGDTTGWGQGPTEDKGAGEDNWGTPFTEDQNDGWDVEESENSIKNTSEWVSNQRRDGNRPPRGRGGRGGGRGGRGERGRGRGGRGFSRDNYRRGDNDYGRGYKSFSRGGGRNQNSESMLFYLIISMKSHLFFFC
jgi:hypothetical protein